MKMDPDYYVTGVRAGDRKILAKTITLIESALAVHQSLTATVMERLLPHTGNSIRLGITGVPGVGKSTFIESLGMHLISRGHRVAILAVDPSSVRSGGSIMGDKTRMEKLALEEKAFIRPSPSGGTLGGVSRKTRESMLACEAAGYDVVIVETVGVGQSEVSVASMVDFFLLLILAGAGDELQGIKRGVVELADAIAVNKTDGDNIDKAYAAKKVYENAIHLFAPSEWGWTPKVLTCSALETTGIDAIWEMVIAYRDAMTATRALHHKRRRQALEWMTQLLEEGLKDWFYQTPHVRRLMPELTNAVANGTTSPTAAAKKLLDAVNIC